MTTIAGCSICSESLTKVYSVRKGPGPTSATQPDGVNALVTPCGHAFHAYCISHWMKKEAGPHGSCPICRREIVDKRCSPLFLDEIDSSELELAHLAKFKKATNKLTNQLIAAEEAGDINDRQAAELTANLNSARNAAQARCSSSNERRTTQKAAAPLDEDAQPGPSRCRMPTSTQLAQTTFSANSSNSRSRPCFNYTFYSNSSSSDSSSSSSSSSSSGSSSSSSSSSSSDDSGSSSDDNSSDDAVVGILKPSKNIQSRLLETRKKHTNPRIGKQAKQTNHRLKKQSKHANP